MRQIIRRREIVADDLRYLGEETEPGTRGVVPFAQLLADAAAGRPPTGAAVLLGPTDEVEVLMPLLSGVDTVVVDFLKFGDGRGFTQGRLLRTRGAFRGELRARGALKRDLLFFLARCGFDAFDLDPSEDLVASLRALDSFSVAYQASSDELVKVRYR